MFDIGFFELILIAIIGLVVLGPERLPHAIRMTSAWVGKIRRASMAVKDELEREINAHEMQQRIKQQIEASGMEDLKKTVEATAKDAQDHITPSLTDAPTKPKAAASTPPTDA